MFNKTFAKREKVFFAKKRRTERPALFCDCSNNYELVEMRGLAPLYRQTTKRLSTCVVCLFFVPSAKSANRPNRR